MHASANTRSCRHRHAAGTMETSDSLSPRDAQLGPHGVLPGGSWRRRFSITRQQVFKEAAPVAVRSSSGARSWATALGMPTSGLQQGTQWTHALLIADFEWSATAPRTTRCPVCLQAEPGRLRSRCRVHSIREGAWARTAVVALIQYRGEGSGLQLLSAARDHLDVDYVGPQGGACR